MDKRLAVGTTIFALLSILLGLLAQALLEAAGIGSTWGGQAGTHLVATPLAIFCALRVGRLTRLSVFAATLFVAIACMAAVVCILNDVAEPAGGHVGWSSLFTPNVWRSTAFGGLAMLFVPQLWLWLAHRLAANIRLSRRRSAARLNSSVRRQWIVL